MGAFAPIQSNFNAGELSETTSGRVDVGKYANGCRRMVGFIPLVQGPARARSGTRFVRAVKDSADRCWLHRVEFSDNRGFVLEFGDQYVRFYTDHGILIEDAASPYSPFENYVPGDVVGSGVNVYYCLREVSGVVPPNATYWYQLEISGGDILYEVPTPYAVGDLTASDGTLRLWFEQSGDVLYIFHPLYPPQKLIRHNNTKWELAEIEFEGGPFIGVNPDETTTVYASAATGTGITLTASTSIFTSDHVGTQFLIEVKYADTVSQWEPGKAIGATGLERRSIGNVYGSQTTGTTGSIRPIHLDGERTDGDPGVRWEYLHSGYGIVRITAAAGTTATADVVLRIPSQAVGAGNPTTRWSFSEFTAARGYPSHGKIFRERLAVFRKTQGWMSVAGDFENFSERDGADVTAEMAIKLPAVSGYDVTWVDVIGDLLVGTIRDEVAISEITGGEALGPSNVMPKPQTAMGSRNIRPIRYNDSILFAPRGGRKIRELRYTFESEGYATADLTVLADHVLNGRVIQMDFQLEPHSIAWIVCNDGSFVGFTFNREQEVTGFHRHPIGGTDSVVESCACIQSPDGDRDEVWMIVSRTVDGATARYVEYMERDFVSSEGMTLPDAFFLDSGLSYTVPAGPGVTTITGLDHLEGETVKAVIDGVLDGQLNIVTGEFESDKTVSGGSITLVSTAPAGAIVSVGLDFVAEMIPMRPEGGYEIGTAQGKTKRIVDMVLRVQDSVTGQVGTDGGRMEDIRYPEVGLYTGDTEKIPWPEGWETDAYMLIKRSEPLPLTVSAIMPVIKVTG